MKNYEIQYLAKPSVSTQYELTLMKLTKTIGSYRSLKVWFTRHFWRWTFRHILACLRSASRSPEFTLIFYANNKLLFIFVYPEKHIKLKSYRYSPTEIAPCIIGLPYKDIKWKIKCLLITETIIVLCKVLSNLICGKVSI